MIADDAAMPLVADVPQRIVSRARHALTHLWACWWWTLRVHMAAVHGIPRSALEAPPDPRLAALAGPPPALSRRRDGA